MPQAIDFGKLLSLFSYDKYDPLLFGSSLFLFFFLFVLLVQRLFSNQKALRIYSLLFFSLFFYYKAAGIYLLLLVFSSAFNFYFGKLIYESKTALLKKIFFITALLVNLGLLGYFKYTNFFLQILTDLKLGTIEPLHIFLPIGISFFTFKALSYVIEIYLEMFEPVKSFRDFSLFIFFFPNVLMGPIDRASVFLPQIEEDNPITKEDVGRALFLISCGLIKKYAIADYIALNFDERVFGFPLRFTGVENLLAIYGRALQGYCDFSGYTDMALGVGLLLGYKLMDNFNRPFKATSVGDYWRRWHLSLSTWLLDYLFKPLQISFRSMRKWGTALAIFFTFFAVGLWHGPNWTFIFFGILHSVYLIFGMFTQSLRKKFTDSIKITGTKFHKFLQVVFTFHLLAFTAILFGSPSLQYTLDMLHQIFTFFHPEVFPQFVQAYTTVFVLIVFGYVVHFLPKSIEVKAQNLVIKMPVVFQAVLFAVVIWIVVQFKSAAMMPFIYFQF
ncbi:MAG: MBOAT family O-acyltransferase [Ignavibacteriaceae bacterium]|jgi:D-alanyl-lipoteichoic acid acyltransferase DltB (MBOAT superfamily)